MSAQRRASCPYCKRSVAVTAAGRFWTHRDNGGAYCAGSSARRAAAPGAPGMSVPDAAYSLLHAEVATTVRLGLNRGAGPDEIAGDVLAEILSVDPERRWFLARLLVALREQDA